MLGECVSHKYTSVNHALTVFINELHHCRRFDLLLGETEDAFEDSVHDCVSRESNHVHLFLGAGILFDHLLQCRISFTNHRC